MNPESFAPSPGGAPPKEATSASLRADVLEASLRRPVVVEFYAPGAAPCAALGRNLARLVGATEGKLAHVRLNVAAEPEIGAQLGVKALPAAIVFERGRATDGFVGALSEKELRGFLERLVGPIAADEDAFRRLEQLQAEGDLAGAEALLRSLVEQEEAPPARAVAELVRLLIDSERLDEAETLLAAAPEPLRRDPAVAAAAAALENARQASALGEVEELRRRTVASPQDAQARFDLALALNAKGLREEAAAELLDIVRRDRSWNDDGARKQLVQFFEAWGPTDKATVAARRKLSSLLFS
jgi:putative thioredoxin